VGQPTSEGAGYQTPDAGQEKENNHATENGDENPDHDVDDIHHQGRQLAFEKWQKQHHDPP
jgi:hypothetical protein